jgi:hypothetical protein
MLKSTYANPTCNYQRRWPAWKWLLLAVGCFMVMVVLFVPPLVMKIHPGHGHNFNEATNNMRQIGFGLLMFEADFEAFPNDLTIELVRERHPESNILLGRSSSNDYFHQLFAAEILQSPSIFHGYGISKRRHRELLDGQPPLPPGTCGYAYIIRDAETTPRDTPILAYPMVRGKLIFDKKLCKRWGNKALVLHADLGARSYPIDSSGRIMIDGRDLFDPEQPHWNGKPFRVVWPE